MQKKTDFLSKKALTEIHKNGPTKELIGIKILGNFQDEFSSDYLSIYSEMTLVVQHEANDLHPLFLEWCVLESIY